ncbi:hypothetical protein AB0M28_12600 [Streptomyces sp. NPDC051940]|uniref:hypothetical protein n=1 Tax=Streptomyces sp. NPDC051940 TaxID=3155675 RepID=UPI003444D706
MSFKPATRAAVPPLVIATLLALTACGGDSDDGKPTDASSSPAAQADTAVDLSGVCPATVVVQASWMPNTTSEGALYTLLGDNPQIDAGKKRVTAPLMSGGKDTGVKLEIRAGGPAIGFTPTTVQLYTDDSINLGVLTVDESVQMSAKMPTTAVTALLEKDPQMVFWDPATHPDFKTIADIGKTDTKVLYFDGDTYMEYLTGSGILKKSQVDGSFDGSPSRFVAAEGKVASAGYAVESPYTYEHDVKQWGKPVAFQLLYDAGYPNYGNNLVVRAGDKDKLAPCLKKLVPVVQQAQVDFLADPAPAIDKAVAANDAYKGGFVFTKGAGEFAAEQLAKLGIAANDAEGKDTTAGNFDTARIQKMIDITTPIFTQQKKAPKDGLTPDDLVTNEFIDPKIGYPNAG